MALPKIDVPTYDLTFPHSGETIKVRPFSVKEEKLLLLALESKDTMEITNTVKQVVNNCIISGKYDVNKAPFFEVDFIFIFLRAKSVGESVEINLTCNNTLEDGRRCGHTFPANIDISNRSPFVYFIILTVFIFVIYSKQWVFQHIFHILYEHIQVF